MFFPAQNPPIPNPACILSTMFGLLWAVCFFFVLRTQITPPTPGRRLRARNIGPMVSVSPKKNCKTKLLEWLVFFPKKWDHPQGLGGSKGSMGSPIYTGWTRWNWIRFEAFRCPSADCSDLWRFWTSLSIRKPLKIQNYSYFGDLDLAKSRFKLTLPLEGPNWSLGFENLNNNDEKTVKPGSWIIWRVSCIIDMTFTRSCGWGQPIVVRGFRLGKMGGSSENLLIFCLAPPWMSCWKLGSMVRISGL